MAPNRKRLQSGKLIVKFMPKMANNWSLQSLALFNWNSSDFIQSELWRLSQNGQFPCAKPSALFYRLAISNFACVVGCFIIQEAVGPLFFFKKKRAIDRLNPTSAINCWMLLHQPVRFTRIPLVRNTSTRATGNQFRFSKNFHRLVSSKKRQTHSAKKKKKKKT